MPPWTQLTLLVACSSNELEYNGNRFATMCGEMIAMSSAKDLRVKK